jgi:hypothetical protein
MPENTSATSVFEQYRAHLNPRLPAVCITTSAAAQNVEIWGLRDAVELLSNINLLPESAVGAGDWPG